MQKLKIGLTKNKQGRKEYYLELTDCEHLQTVFEQFQLSLPLNIKPDQLYVKSFNSIDLASKDRYKYNDLIKAFVQIKDSQKLLVMYKDHLDELFITKYKLSKKEINSLIGQQGYGHVEFHDFNYYCIDRGRIQLPEDKDQEQQEHEEFVASMPDLTVKNYKDLQKNALALRSRYLKLKDQYDAMMNANESMRQIVMKSSEDTGNLSDQIAKLQQDLKDSKENKDAMQTKLHDFLRDNYDQYLRSDDGLLLFIQSLINNRYSPNVQKLYNYRTENLLELIAAVATYNKENDN